MVYERRMGRVVHAWCPDSLVSLLHRKSRTRHHCYLATSLPVIAVSQSLFEHGRHRFIGQILVIHDVEILLRVLFQPFDGITDNLFFSSPLAWMVLSLK